MKILFLHMTQGLSDRGSEISTDLLANALTDKHEVLVLQSGKPAKKKYTIQRVFPLNIAPPPAPTNLLEKIRSRLSLDKNSLAVRRFTYAAIPEILKFEPDIIVATNGSPQLHILHKHVSNAKIVVFGRAGIGHHDLDNLKARPDLFIALTLPAESWARTNAPPNTKVVYIPNPISLSQAKPIKLNLPHPVIMTVGALSKYKNIPNVIRAVSQLEASFLLIGDGEASGEVATELDHFPGDFRWIRHVDPKEISSYYASANIFCFVPDSQEAFGRVYLEAMMAHLPIVASDDPIRRAIVGDQGVYVDPHNQEELVEALQLASTKGKINYSVELKPYQLETVVAQIEKEFYGLIK